MNPKERQCYRKLIFSFHPKARGQIVISFTLHDHFVDQINHEPIENDMGIFIMILSVCRCY